MRDDFPDHDYLTVRELADLLRLKERKVYDLAASGAVPCSRATGKLLFPAAEIRAWIEAAKSGGPRPDRPRPPIVLGSHDPLMEWAIRESGSGLATSADGSGDGLSRFAAGEGVACGIHVMDPRTSEWNVPAARRAAEGLNAVLIAVARRSRGLVYRPGGPVPSGIADLARMRTVPRQDGSGAQTLLAILAGRAGLDPATLDLAPVARTEDDAVDTVRRGDADAAFGLASVARAYGLGFAPLVEEEFALLVDRRAFFTPALQRLMAFCRTDAFRARADALGGYDTAPFGRILWNA